VFKALSSPPNYQPASYQQAGPDVLGKLARTSSASWRGRPRPCPTLHILKGRLSPNVQGKTSGAGVTSHATLPCIRFTLNYFCWMSTKYKATMPGKAFFVTITTVYWVDLFTRVSLRTILVNALNYCSRNKGLEIYAYCLMSNHLHMMCRAPEEARLSDILRDFKTVTSKRIIHYILHENESRKEWLLDLFSKACEHLKRDQQYKVWQTGYHAVLVESNKFIYQKLNYIHNNPVVNGIVENPEEYIYSSARNYADKVSLVDVVVLPHEVKGRKPSSKPTHL
jgi:REP element-mobilizing transposase RayT